MCTAHSLDEVTWRQRRRPQTAGEVLDIRHQDGKLGASKFAKKCCVLMTSVYTISETLSGTPSILIYLNAIVPLFKYKLSSSLSTATHK